ncbi:MAG: M28 family peptidase [Armatimonadota bacterium]
MRITAIIALLAICLSALSGCAPAEQVPRFDAERAFKLLKDQVDLGPRYPGSPGHDVALGFIRSQLKPYADSVGTLGYTHTIRGKQIRLVNVLAFFNPGADKRILLAAHWDTRPTADCEVDPQKKSKPIPGANDGASGVAVLLELARMFHVRKPDVGVVMVFFDGEDYGPDLDSMFLGSRLSAGTLARGVSAGGKRVPFSYGILLDMVGDKNLCVYREKNSVDAAPQVVDKVWTAAKELGYQDKFRPDVKYAIDDDHVPLIKAGIRCIDVIDFDYGPWHTLDDTPDKCSAASLQVVGEVIARVVYHEKP